jgi:hypothetical protein
MQVPSYNYSGGEVVNAAYGFIDIGTGNLGFCPGKKVFDDVEVKTGF